jgi:hypothetical protein
VKSTCVVWRRNEEAGDGRVLRRTGFRKRENRYLETLNSSMNR